MCYAAIPQLPLFRSLHTLLSTYPSAIRALLLEHLHSDLMLTLPAEPSALKLHATRFLPASGEPEATEDFIDRLRTANEELLEKARTHRGAVSGVYAEFVAEWCERAIEPDLVHILRLADASRTNDEPFWVPSDCT